MTKQITNTLLMIRPYHFRMNEETAVNNYYQQKTTTQIDSTVLAQNEFDTFVAKLRAVGIQVIVVQDNNTHDTPDAIFPNNWISFHANGSIALYPMFAENRRLERSENILKAVEDNGFEIQSVVDYSSAEVEGVFLEGTGSMILDREHKLAFCALSPRSNESLFIEFCEDFEYTPVVFTAFQTVDNNRMEIYHTNVMMCIGANFAVVCLDAIDNLKERKSLIRFLKSSKKTIIPITEAQVKAFAGNMLEVKGFGKKSYTIMSTSAFNVLSENQKQSIQQHSEILHSAMPTIETCGGGSARCMMAEVFLPNSI